MTREEILKTAAKIVNGQREDDYGSPEDCFATIAELWVAYMRDKCVSPGADMTILPEDVAVMMVLLKIARLVHGNGTADTWIDIAGYAACGGEIATKDEGDNT